MLLFILLNILKIILIIAIIYWAIRYQFLLQFHLLIIYAFFPLFSLDHDMHKYLLSFVLEIYCQLIFIS